MTNLIQLAGGAHERPTKLSSEQREAIIGRWPVRFTTGQALADRALWTMYRESVMVASSATPHQEQTLGSSVVSLETKRHQPKVTQAEAHLDLHNVEADAQTYDLDAIRNAVHASYPIENGESYDQKAA